MDALIIGIDLSFSRTGITFMVVHDHDVTSVEFHRVMFDDQSRKDNRDYSPEHVININDTVYRLPSNITSTKLHMSLGNMNNLDQCDITLKSMIATKKIMNIILDKVTRCKPSMMIVGIENYIMPAYGGKASLKIVGGLISLQALVRSKIIEYCLSNDIIIRLDTPTASELKYFFSSHGGSSKDDMCDIFVKMWDGKKLLPVVETSKVNDVIDSFALACKCYYSHVKQELMLMKLSSKHV
jgi:hypothetical protein